jgi:hypothetical protein
LARKNIKEYEEKTKEALEKIQAAVELASEVTLEPGHAAFEDFLSKKGTKNRVGEVYFSYVEALENHLQRDFKEDTAKQALQNAWTTGVLKIVPGTHKKGESGYVKTAIDNGDLVVTVYDWCNVGETGAGLLDKLGDSSTGLPVKAVQNMKEYEERRTELLQAIQAATGVATEVTLDVDPATFGKLNQVERVGELIHSYLDAAKYVFERNFKDDELAKEALQAVWTTGVLKLEVGTLKKGESSYYVKSDCRDGDLVITVISWCNVSDTASDLIGKLSHPATNLPLKAAQNMRENEEKRNEQLQEIHDNCQLACDVTLDCNAPEFGAKIKQLDRVGDIINSYLEAIAYLTKRLFKDDELLRSAIQAAWTTGVLRIEGGTKKKDQSGYSDVNIKDGDFVVTVFDWCNVSDTGSDLINKLGDPSSGLPLKAAADIKAQEETKTESLEKIKEAVGLGTDVTFDVDWAVIHPFCVKNGYGDRCGEVVFNWILGGLRDSLVRSCREELTKEAIAETWSTGVIRLEAGPPKMNRYHQCDFVDGDLVIKFKPDSMATNVGEIGSDIEGKL